MKNGVDFDTNSVITALNDGVSVRIDELEAGFTGESGNVVNGELYIDYTTADNKNENIKNVNWAGFEVVESSDGLSVENGEIRVTKDGTVVLSDGISTINIVISGYQSCVQKVLGDGATIEAINGELPMGASAEYKDLSDKAESIAAEYGLIPEEEKKETGFSAFDVSVTTPDGEKDVQGSFAVTVEHNIQIPEGAKVELFHIHNGEVELVEGAKVEDGKVTFVTDGFSEYVIRYTVEFHGNDGEEVIIEGGSQILLSDLLARLGYNIDVTEIAVVEFSDEHLVEVQKVSGAVEVNGESIDVGERDYLLTSKEPFTTQESLKMVLDDGTELWIRVTDDASTNLNAFLTDYDILDNRQESVITENGYIITKVNGNYMLSLHFAEDESKQFDNESTLDFAVPEGITLDNSVGTGSTFSITIGKKVIPGNTISIVNGADGKKHIQVTFNKAHKNFSYLATSANVSFDLDFGVTFDRTTIKKEFKDSETGDPYIVEVQNPHNASVKKTATYDSNNHRMTYKIIIHSTDGDSENVSLTDTITGTALELVKNYGNQGATVYYSDEYGNNNGQTDPAIVETHTISEDKKSLTMSINKVPQDRYVTVEYTADVDYNDIAKSGNASFSETGNTVKIEVPGDDNPDDNEDRHEESNIVFSTVDKVVEETSEAQTDTDGSFYRLLTYKVTANPECLASLKGSQIKDMLKIPADMSYYKAGEYASGLKVVVKDKDGAAVSGSPRTVSWNDLGVSGDEKSWAYNVPADDGNYSYEITYQVKVKIDDVAEAPKYVKNTAETKHSEKTVETPVTPKTQITKPVMKKVADKVEDGKITWKIMISVPAAGMNKPYDVIDTIPANSAGGNSDLHDIVTSVTVEGNVPGDGYSSQIIPSRPDDPSWGSREVDIHFDKFVGTGADRTLTVTVETQINPIWLENMRQALETNPNAIWNYYQHKNSAQAKIDGQNEGQPSEPIINIVPENVKKVTIADASTTEITDMADYTSWPSNGDAWSNSNWRNWPYYAFTITVEGNTKDSMVIQEYFDTSLFEVFDATKWKAKSDSTFSENGKVYPGTNPTTFGEPTFYATITPNAMGAEIRADKLPVDPDTGFVYSYYKVTVYLIPKDPAALKEYAIKYGELIYDENGNATGKKYAFTNRAEWQGVPGTSEYNSKVEGVLNKTGSYDQTKNEASFTIKINPNKEKINNGVNYDLTDTYQNMTVLADGNFTISAVDKDGHSVPAMIFGSLEEANTWLEQNENQNYDGIVAMIHADAKKIFVDEIPDETSVEIKYVGKSEKEATVKDGKAEEILNNRVDVLDYNYTWSQTNNYDFISKTKSSTADANGYVTFTIDFNPKQLKLKNGSNIDISDAYTGGLDIDTESFNVVCDPSDKTPSATDIKSAMRTEAYSDSYGSGQKYTFTVPDATHVTITYKGKPTYTVDASTDERGIVSTDYRNTAEAENVPSVVTGGGNEYVLKKDAGQMITGESSDFVGMIPFRIVYNPEKLTQNGGNPITLTDDFTNLLVEYSTVQVTVEPADPSASTEYDYDYSGTVGTFVVPDSAKITLEYYARPDFTSGSTVEWSNTVRAHGFQDSTSGNVNETISGAGRGDLGNVLWLFKYESGHMTIALSNVEFELYMDDGAGNMIPVTRQDGSIVTFTTKADSQKGAGYVQMTLEGSGDKAVNSRFTDSSGAAFKQNTIYFLREKTRLDGYYVNNETYNFVLHDTTKTETDGTVTRLPDYVKPEYMAGKSVYVFGRDDIVKVTNDRITDEVSLKKNWVNADGTWAWPEDILKVTAKIQKKDGENLIDLAGENTPHYYYEEGEVITGADGSIWSDTLELTKSAPKVSWKHLDIAEENDTWTYVVSEVSVTTKDGTFNVEDGKVDVTVDGVHKVYTIDNGDVSNGKATVTNVEETDVTVKKEWSGVPNTIKFDLPADAVVVDSSKVEDGKVTISRSDLIVKANLHRSGLRAGDSLDIAPYSDDDIQLLTSVNDWTYT